MHFQKKKKETYDFVKSWIRPHWTQHNFLYNSLGQQGQAFTEPFQFLAC